MIATFVADEFKFPICPFVGLIAAMEDKSITIVGSTPFAIEVEDCRPCVQCVGGCCVVHDVLRKIECPFINGLPPTRRSE